MRVGRLQRLLGETVRYLSESLAPTYHMCEGWEDWQLAEKGGRILLKEGRSS